MTERHTNTPMGATHTVLSKDGTRISYLSIGSGQPVLDHFGIEKAAPREVAKAVSDYFLK